MSIVALWATCYYYWLSTTIGAGWYIGATDKAVEGEFVWMNSKTTFSNQQTFKDWYPGEPRNTNYDEGCVVIWKAYGLKWGDISCEFKGNYICER